MDEDKKKLWKKAIKWPLYSVAILPVLITGAYILNQYEKVKIYNLIAFTLAAILILIWENLNPKELEYRNLKEERCSIFLNAVRKFIPDIDERIDLKMLGTPITHKKFTNTYCGSYGPAVSAAKGLFPGCKTPVKNLFTCGASTFPGIGIPAVSASGAYAAEQIIGKKEFKTLLKKINL